jgi:tetratricopeptide (TPR) repeat protein
MLNPKNPFRNWALTGAACLLAGALALGQANSSRPESLLRSAAEAFASGDLQSAEQDLNSLLEGSPNDYRALDLLGMLRAQRQRNAEAEALFKRSMQVKPDFAGARIHLGLLYLQMSQTEQAITELQEGLRLAPDRNEAKAALTTAFRDQARAALAGGNAEKALAALISARKLTPEDPDLAFEFGMVALRMSLLSDAIRAFQQTLEARKDDPLALYALGRAYMESAKFDDARQQFAHYLELKPQDPSGHYGLGMSLMSLQRSEEAQGEFERSIALQPAQTESYFRLGVLELEARNLDAAEKNLNHVLERDPNHAGALAALGRLQLERKKFDEAAALLERAVKSNDSLREAHYYLGLTYARMGRKEDSEKQLQIASRIDQEEAERQRTFFKVLDPGSPEAQNPAK